MNCEQAGELAGAYALDALDASEAAAFRAHIATCGEHAALAAELRATASRLPDSVEPVDPPAALRARLLDAIEREPQAGTAEVASFADAARARDARSSTSRWWRPNAWTAIAAALALFAVAAGAWALASSGSDGGGELAASASGVRSLVDAEGERVGTVVLFEDQGQAQVIFDDLPDAGAGQSYQMWSIEGGGAVSLAVMDEGTQGALVSVVDFDASQSEALAVTVEPAGGSDQPTSEPVYVVEL